MLIWHNQLTRNADKSKYIYNGRGRAFDGAGKWNSCNDYARDAVTFGVDNTSSSHANNRKNNFLALGEEPTYEINGRVGTPENKFSINFSKVKTKFCLSLHYNRDNSYLYMNETEICKFKAHDNIC